MARQPGSRNRRLVEERRFIAEHAWTILEDGLGRRLNDAERTVLASLLASHAGILAPVDRREDVAGRLSMSYHQAKRVEDRLAGPLGERATKVWQARRKRRESAEQGIFPVFLQEWPA